MLGGDTGSGGRFNDVWSSSAINWTEEVNAAPWPARTVHTSVVFDNKMWMIGRGYSDNTRYSTNGNDWIQVQDIAPFGDRIQHSVAIHEGRIWLISGSVKSPLL